VEKRKTIDATGDVEMNSTPAEEEKKSQEKDKDNSEKGEVEEPDWNLFHALRSTRGAMADLRETARKTPPEEVIDVRIDGLGQGGNSVAIPIPRVSVNGSSTGTRTPGTRASGLPEAGVHRSLMIARAEGR
jgi:hypothetical protein